MLSVLASFSTSMKQSKTTLQLLFLFVLLLLTRTCQLGFWLERTCNEENRSYIEEHMITSMIIARVYMGFRVD